MNKRIITDLDEFLAYFGVTYNPELPNPNEFEGHVLRIPTKIDLFQTDPKEPEGVIQEEVYHQEIIGFNDKPPYKIWKRVK